MSFRFAASALVLALSVGACHHAPSTRPTPASKTAQKGSAKKSPANAKAGRDEQLADSEKAKNDDAKSDQAKKETVAKNDARKAKRDPGAAGLTDAQVVATVLAFNNADVSFARIAASRARNAQVRAYATRMLTDNASVHQYAMEMITRTDITIEDNATTLDLREISAERRDRLRAVPDAEFDAAYISGEAAYYEAVLVHFDRFLVPASRDPELKKLVAAVRPVVAAHLAQAEQITQALAAGGN